MIKILMASLVIAGSVPAGSLQAQKPANFAGTWVPVATAKPGNELVITQTATQLNVDYLSGGKSVRKDEIIVDGAPHERKVNMRGTEIVIGYKASWQGGKLAMTVDTSYPNGMKTNGTETWSIDSRGQLVIDTTEKGPRGDGVNGQMILARKK